MSVSIYAHVEQHKLGQVYYAPIDVFLDEHNSPQPDLVFVATRQLAMITSNGIEGVPTLVVEIISPASIIRDRVTKKALYERSGVQAYWLVDPKIRKSKSTRFGMVSTCCLAQLHRWKANSNQPF
ncbi:Uma2 family endonuclease [Fibrisoma montanum]|uniref:Uma2 family endonuclease n=1 Tax=Fibrisoma montanum TaxID=2305895 RepID=UPI001E2D0C6C|nr:Uma2 family endonuclease [Fibrisoma montanum]